MKWKSWVMRAVLFLFGATLLTHSPGAFAASHREAPITALDQKADITDWFAFVSPEHPDHVVMILNVDPFLEPSNGPNYFPFDPGILYEMHTDNNFDGEDDVTFQFRFHTDTRLPDVFTGFVGGIAGIPPITALDGAGSEGLSLRQSYTVTIIRGNRPPNQLSFGRKLFAVPTNVGPRTMPDYSSLRKQGIYDLGHGFRVFAGTVADPFFIDLGAAFDSLNFRKDAGGGVLSPVVDADDHHNFAPNALSGFNVNTIVLEVPTWILLQGGHLHPPTSKFAVIGTYGSTSRPRAQMHDKGDLDSSNSYAKFAQVQRMGNALINELIIGTGFKDRFSMDDPVNDSQFANFFLNPLLATTFGSIGIPVKSAPRTDLLPLVQYMAPFAPAAVLKMLALSRICFA